MDNTSQTRVRLIEYFNTGRQSTPVLNKRDGLKTVTVDVSSGVAEVGCVRGSGSVRCVSCVILVFVTQSNKCCVYQALAPEF